MPSEYGDETLTPFSNSPPGSTKAAIGRSRFNRRFNRSRLVDLETLDFFLNDLTGSLTRNTLPHAAQDQIPQTKSFNP